MPSLNPHHPHTNLQDFLDSKVWLCWGQLLSRHWPAVRCVRSCLLNRSLSTLNLHPQPELPSTRQVKPTALYTAKDKKVVRSLLFTDLP